LITHGNWITRPKPLHFAFVAVVESNPNERGFFRIWFPLLASRVQKIALQARQALKAANVAVATP
jgi:hypothetical protein